jgi:anti-sigma regulatory factor (Ser/Thr protein kinase)
MSVGVARSAGPETGVTVSIARDPALVRTVRLIAAAVARRTGQDDQFVEEIRLAVGEACALMVGESSVEHAAADPVVVSLSISQRLRVRVVSTGPVAAHQRPVSFSHVEPWALLRGLLEDFTVEQDGTTTTLSMSWALS